MMKRGILVEVRWLDAEAESMWTSIKDVSTKAENVRSVGYVLHDNADAIVLAADVGDTLGEDDTVMRTMVIPRGMIQKVRRLT